MGGNTGIKDGGVWLFLSISTTLQVSLQIQSNSSPSKALESRSGTYSDPFLSAPSLAARSLGLQAINISEMRARSRRLTLDDLSSTKLRLQSDLTSVFLCNNRGSFLARASMMIAPGCRLSPGYAPTASATRTVSSLHDHPQCRLATFGSRSHRSCLTFSCQCGRSGMKSVMK